MSSTDIHQHDLTQLLKAPFLLEQEKDLPLAFDLPIHLEAIQSIHINKQNFRLGKYIENLLSEYLTHHPNISELLSGIQIFDQHKTIGELDFIFKYQDRFYHWEVTQKFYLLHHHQGISRYFGPQGKDRLDLKVKKLIEHQLPLAKNEVTLKTISQKDLHSRAYVKGTIFYHKSNKITPPTWPNLSPHHSKGWWLRLNEFLPYFSQTETRLSFLVLPKTRWLTSGDWMLSQTKADPMKECFEKLTSHFEKLSHSIMLIIYQNGKELNRGFIVPNNWPRI